MKAMRLWMVLVLVTQVDCACQYFAESTAETCYDSASFPMSYPVIEQAECLNVAKNILVVTAKTSVGLEADPSWPYGCYVYTLSNNEVYLNTPSVTPVGQRCAKNGALCVCRTADCLPPTDAPPTPAPPTAVPTDAPATDPPATPAPPTAVPTNAPATPAPPTAQPTAEPTDAPATPAPPTAQPTAEPTDAPATDAPATDPPATDPPATNPPDTDAPATPAPPTAVPTDAPPTPAPPTAVPTVAPPTPAPPTAVPTDAPPTPAPPTAVPTDAPATPAPPTAVPTDAPPTLAPPTAVPTDAPATPAPPTPAPPTAVPTNPPVTPAPPTLIPATAVPTVAPDTPAPPTAVPTQAPDTPAPPTATPTQAPDTNPPDTAVPTAAPDTQAPPTAVPTDAPPTAIPTKAPDTGAPDTMAPATNPPDTVGPTPVPTLDPNVLKNHAALEEIDKDLAIATAVLGPLSGPAAPQAAMIAVMLDGTCNSEDKKLSFALHPTQIDLYGSYAAGAVVGNLAIVIGAVAVLYCVLHLMVLCKCITETEHVLDAQGMMRFPSAPLFILLFFYQGTFLGAFRLIISPDPGWLRSWGLAAAGLLIGAPIWIGWKINKDVDKFTKDGKGYYRTDDQVRGKLFNFIVGPGEWVSTTKRNHWVQRYQTMVRSFKQKYSWFIVGDFLLMALMAGARVTNTDSWVRCGNVRLFMSLVNWIALIIEGYLLPHARMRDNVMDVMRLFMQGLGLLCMAIGFYSETYDHWGFRAASPIFIGVMVLIILKLVMDMVTEGWIFFSKRRLRLQRATWGDDENELKELEDTFGLEPEFHKLPPAKESQQSYSPLHSPRNILESTSESSNVGTITNMSLSIAPKKKVSKEDGELAATKRKFAGSIMGGDLQRAQQVYADLEALCPEGADIASKVISSHIPGVDEDTIADNPISYLQLAVQQNSRPASPPQPRRGLTSRRSSVPATTVGSITSASSFSHRSQSLWEGDGSDSPQPRRIAGLRPKGRGLPTRGSSPASSSPIAHEHV
eukprot:TRINITY_DN821_c3_g1_i1.p1 TRINITY_DN821_c3_g1~~TRINITY_DN821_c3_g1_i1.p1  ORF type:complete len:1015 (+),score=197.13 TRINITY_DN821_c3_g1_i1:205-3249(+)